MNHPGRTLVRHGRSPGPEAGPGATASPGDPVCVGLSSRMIKATHGEADQWEAFKGGHIILTLGRRSAARWLSRGHHTWRAPARRRPLERESVVYRNREQALSEELD